MTTLYLFAAAAGVPLLVWFLLSGGDEAGEGDGIGGVMLRLLPLSTLAIASATFGICGLLLGLIDTGPTMTFVAAAAIGVLAAVLNSSAFAYLRRSESSAAVNEGQLAGAVGRVVVPVSAGHRGRVAISAGGQQVYLSACALPYADDGEELEVGAPVLVVEVRDGIASVTRLDPELT